MGIFRRLFGDSITSRYIGEAKNVVAFLNELGPSELVEAKTCVALAFSVLIADAEQDNNKFSQNSFLQNIFEAADLPAKEKNSYSKFDDHIRSLQKQAFEQPGTISKLIAAGMPIWLVCMRASVMPELIPYARQCWTKLEECDPFEYTEAIFRLEEQLAGNPLRDVLSRMRNLQPPNLFSKK